MRSVFLRVSHMGAEQETGVVVTSMRYHLFGEFFPEIPYYRMILSSFS